jgi:hypothetical protein
MCFTSSVAAKVAASRSFGFSRARIRPMFVERSPTLRASLSWIAASLLQLIWIRSSHSAVFRQIVHKVVQGLPKQQSARIDRSATLSRDGRRSDLLRSLPSDIFPSMSRHGRAITRCR